MLKIRMRIWKMEKCTTFVPNKNPFILTHTMKQMHALKTEQERYEEVMSPFEECLLLTRSLQ